LNRELYDVLSTAFGAQEEGLLLVISTQSSDPTSIMSELADEAVKQAAGLEADPYFFGRVFAIPDDLDVFDEANWPLANPALGSFRSLIDMRALAYKAKKSAAAEATFRQLYCNQRVDGVQSLVNSRDWKACEQPIDANALKGLRCYGALDLSRRLDLTAFTLSWLSADNATVFTKSWFWTHENDLADREKLDGALYREWEKAGFLKVCEGKAVNYRTVVRDIAQAITGHDLQGIAFDRFRIDELRANMAYEGISEDEFKLIEHGQGYVGMAPAIDALETRVIESTLRHDGNPIVTWCLSNVRVDSDPAGNRKFDKRERRRRIDGAVTLAMSLSAIAKAERAEVVKPSIYLKRGLREL